MIITDKYSGRFLLFAIFAFTLLAPPSADKAQALTPPDFPMTHKTGGVRPSTPQRPVSEITSSIQARYEDIKTFCADFTQDNFSRALDETESVTGRVYFEKPGKMRWEYDNKEKIISDGKLIWLYQPDLGQIIESTVEGTTPNLAMDFLSGAGSLDEDFHIKIVSTHGMITRLALTPKKAMSNLKTLFIDVSKDFLLVKTIVIDPFDNKTTVTFSNIITDTTKKDKGFKEGFFGIGDIKGAHVVRP